MAMAKIASLLGMHGKHLRVAAVKDGCVEIRQPGMAPAVFHLREDELKNL